MDLPSRIGEAALIGGPHGIWNVSQGVARPQAFEPARARNRSRHFGAASVFS